MPAKTDKMKGKNKGSNKSIILNAVSSSLETQDHAGDIITNNNQNFEFLC